MEHFFPQNQVKTKKRSSPTMEHFFSPNSSGHLRSDAHQSQIIGVIYPPSPRVSAPLDSGHNPELSCQISAYYKIFPGFNVFYRISTGLNMA